MNKNNLLTFLKTKIQDQISELQHNVDSIVIEIGNETKSSAGDKFETAREMMNQERGRLESSIGKLSEQLQFLTQISDKEGLTEVGFGNLVVTNSGTFLFGLPLGKIEFEKEVIFVLSLQSPIGKSFLGKRVGEGVSFNNIKYQIKSIS